MVERSAPAQVEITGTAHQIRHAVAVDEHRVKFKPALLAQDIKTLVKAAIKDPKKEGIKKEDIREVWFPGNHGDVGGGWPAIPTGLKIWRLWNCIFGGTKVDNLDESLQDDHLQMSDIALEWMIREVDIATMVIAANVEDWVIKGFMNDTLSLCYGSSFLRVFMWNLIGMPNWWGRHDTPRGAVLHNSLKELEKADSYRPLNNHGSGEPCLWNSKGVADMRDVTYQRLNQRGQEIKSAVWDSRHKIWQFEDFYAQNAQPRIY
ncbi:uncharacterized protein FFB14_11324 [Fusarium fujikuroi]|nr:uncharacterized protein FFB14_11324 [Fusarium fujikuroi]